MRITLLAGCAFCSLAACGQWEQLPDFPGTPRDDAAYFTISQGGLGLTYVGTGMEVGWGLTNDWWRFDGWLWQQVASLPATPRQYCVAAGVDGKGYVFGGIDVSGALNELWRYDPVEDSWEQMPSLPAEARYAAVALHNGSGGLIIAYGMLASGSPTRETWRFDTQNNTWEALADAPAPARHRAAYDPYHRDVFGGMDITGSVLDDAWSLWNDWPTPQWIAYPSMPGPRFGARAAFGVVIGGASSWAEIHDNVWALDNSGWTEWPPFPGGARRGGAIGTYCCLGGGIFFGLGLDGSMTRRQDWWTMEVFNNINEHPDDALSIRPNPATDEVHCTWPGNAPSVPYALLDAAGRIQFSGLALTNKPIDLSALEAGTYVLRVNLGGRSHCGTIIKLP